MMYRASPNVLPPTDKLKCCDFGRANILWFCLLVFLVLVRIGFGAEAPLPRFVPGQILVKPKAHITDAAFSKRLEVHQATHRKTLDHIHIINVPRERAEAVLSALR